MYVNAEAYAQKDSHSKDLTFSQPRILNSSIKVVPWVGSVRVSQASPVFASMRKKPSTRGLIRGVSNRLIQLASNGFLAM